MLARNFQLFRGGYEITLKFVKTMMHTGRLSITFEPADHSTTLAQAPYVLREIIDLSTVSEITLKIPYLHNTDYLSTGAGAIDSYTDVGLGRLRMHVLTQLRGPETCASEVQIWFYARPDDDFELAVPIPDNTVVFSPESSLSSVLPDTLVEKGIGNAGDAVLSLDAHMSSVHDPLVSIKQLLVSSRIVYTTSTAISTASGYINPSAMAVAKGQNASTYLLPANNLIGDYIGYLSSAYAFCRGGYRITNIGVATSSTNVMTLRNNTMDTNAHGTAPTDYSINSSTFTLGTTKGRGIAAVQVTTGGAMDVIVPHFGCTPIRMVRFQSDPAPYPMTTGATLPDMFKSRLVYSGSMNNAFLRAGADDYALGYFIGFPPMAYLRIPF